MSAIERHKVVPNDDYAWCFPDGGLAAVCEVCGTLAVKPATDARGLDVVAYEWQHSNGLLDPLTERQGYVAAVHRLRGQSPQTEIAEALHDLTTATLYLAGHAGEPGFRVAL